MDLNLCLTNPIFGSSHGIELHEELGEVWRKSTRNEGKSNHDQKNEL